MATSIGSGYDLSASIYSPEGRNFQVEYANKAVENAGTVIGLRVKDGVVLAAEKIIHSKLLVSGANKQILQIDKHTGLAPAGIIADGTAMVDRARSESDAYSDVYRSPIPVKELAKRIGGFVHVFTCYSSVRPFGLSSIIGGLEPVTKKPALYCVEPSGVSWGYRGCAVGKGLQLAKTEIEKLPLESMTIQEAVDEAAHIIHRVHDDTKDKSFELEMTWIGPATNNVHAQVPLHIIQEAERKAKERLTEVMEE